MKNSKLILFLFTTALASTCRAGTELKWAEVPEAVRATVLANGGTAGQTVDRETKGHNIDGQAVFEAAIRDKNGNIADIVVKEDGKLVETKHDDAADAAAEKAAGKLKQGKEGKQAISAPKFSHPRDITNPHLPLAYLKQDIFEGMEGGKKTRVVRTAMPDKHRTFELNGQAVEALVVEDRAFENGELAEVATDYFAQDDDGTVYYLGEDVDEYEDGKVTSHAGSWLLGKETQIPGVLMPAHPQAGDKFKSEDVSKEINESDEVVSVSETAVVPAGTFLNCVKVKESLADGTTEYKYYAPGVGVVREVPSDGDELLISHATR